MKNQLDELSDIVDDAWSLWKSAETMAWETEIPHFRQLASEYQYDFDMAKAEYLKAIRESKDDK